MSRYNLSWRDQIAFRFATRKSRIEAWRNVGLIAALLLAYGIAGEIEYQTEQRIKEQRQLDSEAAYAKVLRDCMSGAQGFYFPDTQKAYECKVLPL